MYGNGGSAQEQGRGRAPTLYPMGRESEGMLSPTPHYYEIKGRAAEIARALASPAGGAEHLFLAMLHDGGWPLAVLSDLADLGRAEAEVLAIIRSAGYAPPPPPRVPVRDGFVPPLGAAVAVEMGDSYLGLEHAFLAMIRGRDTIPSRVLADLADLDALEAAVLAAKIAPPGPSADAVLLPEGQQMNGPLRRAVISALP